MPILHALVFLNIVASAAAATVDLSTPWAQGSLYNKNKAYCTIQAAMAPCYTRGYVVIQNGLLVAEGYTDGNDQNGKYDAYSATKSWSTFFMGVLVDQGELSINDTLNDIFDNDADWEGVGEAAEKKTITVEELLTMTSGLVPGCQVGNRQETLQDVLNHVDFDNNQRGKFAYIGTTHILAQIIFRRSGMTPRQFANSAGIFTELGITDSDFEWDTFGGIEGTAYGLKTNPRIMAKLGQLYLQNGESSNGTQLVASSWVQESETNQLASGDSSNSITGGFIDGYGYQWYNYIDGGSGAYAGVALAGGAQGQLIVYLPVSNTTVAIMSQGCMGVETSRILLRTIVDNLGDLAVEQTTCGTSFSYWKYFAEHSGELLTGLRDVPNVLLGRNQM
jgi:CubicO group peptidase (beta-lactamase class C family)